MSGCASITGSKLQPVSVQVLHNGSPVEGANCSLTNDRGSWFVRSPGSTTVQKSGQNLNISCTKEGIPPGSAQVSSTINGAFMANVLLGGVVGMIVDGASGAGLEYPTGITVTMGQVLNLQPQGSSTPEVSYTTKGTPFAALDNRDAIPFIKDDGKSGYGRFLSERYNRAFAISETGGWGSSWNWKTTSDAIAFALEKCLARSSVPCKIYAVNDDVVWSAPSIATNANTGGLTFASDTHPKPHNASSSGSQKPSATDVQTLKDLKKLLDSGVITQQEFDAKKAAILNRM